MKEKDRLNTRVGYAGWKDHRHFGYSVFKELAGEVTSTGLIVLAATGRLMDEADCRVLDDIAAVLTVADPRIYPLKLVRLASSYGDPLAGLSASVAAMQGAIVGPQISQNAAMWLMEVHSELNGSFSDTEAVRKVVAEQFRKKNRISGFGVPFRDVDERAVALYELAAFRGRTAGEYWRLQETVARIAREIKGLACNVGLPVAALSLDMGLAPERLSSLYTGLTMNVFLANAVEGASQAPEILRRLPETDVEYIGKPPRELS